MKKNVAGQVIGAQMISTAGAAFTSTVSCAVTVDGGTQTAGGGTVTHEGNGFHTYLPTQAETNGDHVAFTFTGTGAVPVTVQVYTTFPQTGDSFARLGAPAGASISADVAGVQSDTNDIQTRLPAALVSGRMDSSVGAMAANVLTATAIAADAITDAKVAADVTIASVTGSVGSVTAGVTVSTNNDKTGYGLSAAAVQAVWDALTTALTTVGSIGKRLADNIDAAISSRLATAGYTAPLDAAGTRAAVGLASANLDTQLTAIDDYLDTEVAAIKAKTDNLPASPAATGDAMTLTSAYDFAKGTVAVTESYAANGVAPSPVQAILGVHQMLMQFAISGTSYTVKKLDNSTTAFVVTLNDATNPTGAART